MNSDLTCCHEILLRAGEVRNRCVGGQRLSHRLSFPTAVARPKAQPKRAERSGQNDGFNQKRVCMRNRHCQWPGCCNLLRLIRAGVMAPSSAAPGSMLPVRLM